MCHILEGTVRLTDADGVAKTFGPRGFVRGGGWVQGNLGKHHAGAQGVFHSRMISARADNDDNFAIAYPGLSRPGSGSVTRGSDLRPALASRDDASCEQSGLCLAWELRQPVRQRKIQGRLQGV
jgi:hypothetical protein